MRLLGFVPFLLSLYVCFAQTGDYTKAKTSVDKQFSKIEIPLTLADEIPDLGEKTKLEKRKSIRINKTIESWNASMLNIPTPSNVLRETIRNITSDINRFNGSIKKCAPMQTEDAYYECRSNANNMRYESATAIIREGLVKGKDNVSVDEAKLLDPPDNTKTSAVCARILETKLIFPTLKYSADEDYAVYADADDPEIKHIVYTNYIGTVRAPHFLYKNLGKIPFDEIKALRKFEELPDSNVVDFFGFLWNETVKMFVIDNTPYVSLMSSYSETYSIYEFNKEDISFDRVCVITGTVAEYVDELGKYTNTCRHVTQKEYEEIEPVDLKGVLSPQDYKAFAMDFIGHEEIPPWDFLSMKQHFQWSSPREYQLYTDYRNEGKKHIVIPMDFSSTAGSGCYFDFYITYTPNMPQKFNNISDLKPTPDHFGGCGGKDSLIRIEGKTYVLNTDSGRGIKYLHEIKKNRKTRILAKRYALSSLFTFMNNAAFYIV